MAPKEYTKKYAGLRKKQSVNKILHLESKHIQHGTTNYLSAIPEFLLDVKMAV